MSYTDQTKRSSTIPMAAVVGVHLAIGYALISGLAFRVIPHIPIVTVGQILPDDPPPPPPHDLTVQKAKATTQPTILLPVHQAEALPPQETLVQTVPTFDFSGPSSGGAMVLPDQPPKASLAHDAIPGGDRLRWITTDDYPSAALRQGITGTVVIAAMIGTDGRVRSCEVTRSSGSQLLDDATCRFYARRAHFTPALDADGNVVAARRVDRFRWQIPGE